MKLLYKLINNFISNLAEFPPLALAMILSLMFIGGLIMINLQTFDWLLFNNSINLYENWNDYYVIEMLKNGKLWFIKEQLLTYPFIILIVFWLTPFVISNDTVLLLGKGSNLDLPKFEPLESKENINI